MAKIQYTPIAGKNFVVVQFPDSQDIENKEGFLDNCKLINSELGLETFGGGSYIVDKNWLAEVNAGNVAEREYTEDEMVDLLDVDYDTEWIEELD